MAVSSSEDNFQDNPQDNPQDISLDNSQDNSTERVHGAIQHFQFLRNNLTSKSKEKFMAISYPQKNSPQKNAQKNSPQGRSQKNTPQKNYTAISSPQGSPAAVQPSQFLRNKFTSKSKERARGDLLSPEKLSEKLFSEKLSPEKLSEKLSPEKL